MFGWFSEASSLRFALETARGGRDRARTLGQDLDRDVAIELRVARAIHLAHAAGAEGGEDLVRAEAERRVVRLAVAVAGLYAPACMDLPAKSGIANRGVTPDRPVHDSGLVACSVPVATEAPGRDRCLHRVEKAPRLQKRSPSIIASPRRQLPGLPPFERGRIG